jgi:hypothetical protein
MTTIDQKYQISKVAYASEILKKILQPTDEINILYCPSYRSGFIVSDDGQRIMRLVYKMMNESPNVFGAILSQVDDYGIEAVVYGRCRSQIFC